jgi:adenylate cyclase class IV
MARNVEIKARVGNPSQLYARALAVADGGPVTMLQDDTFFDCPNGRLKLRAFSESEGELIFDSRLDLLGPKESQYFLTPTASPANLRGTLASALGVCGRVRKKRTVFHVGSTRIHLDDVEGLGDVMELEVVLSEDQSVAAGIAIAQRIMLQLAICQDDLVDRAYVDLLKGNAD